MRDSGELVTADLNFNSLRNNFELFTRKTNENVDIFLRWNYVVL